MKSSGDTKSKPGRLAALKSWLQAGYNIGWDLGQGLTLFLPKGLFQPFKKIAPIQERHAKSKRAHSQAWWQSLAATDKFNYTAKRLIKNGLLTPAMYLANYIVSPILGLCMGFLSMFPGLIGGLVFNQHIRNLEYHYAINVVDQHSSTAVWGALGMGAIFTYTAMGGGFGIPGFTLPSFGLASALTVSPFLANWIVPMAAAYGIMILLSVGQAIDRVYDISRLFAFHSGAKQTWSFPLKGKLNFRLKNEAIKERTKSLCLSELKQMASLYTEKADEYRQQFEKEPYQENLTQKGLLTQYGLIGELSKLIDAVADAPDEVSKNKILDQREQSFSKRIKHIK